MKLFGIYDNISGHYLAWLVEINVGTCIRAIRSRFKSSDFETFSQDFSLYELANVDDKSGSINSIDVAGFCCHFDEIFNAIPINEEV